MGRGGRSTPAAAAQPHAAMAMAAAGFEGWPKGPAGGGSGEGSPRSGCWLRRNPAAPGGGAGGHEPSGVAPMCSWSASGKPPGREPIGLDDGIAAAGGERGGTAGQPRGCPELAAAAAAASAMRPRADRYATVRCVSMLMAGSPAALLLPPTSAPDNATPGTESGGAGLPKAANALACGGPAPACSAAPDDTAGKPAASLSSAQCAGASRRASLLRSSAPSVGEISRWRGSKLSRSSIEPLLPANAEDAPLDSPPLAAAGAACTAASRPGRDSSAACLRPSRSRPDERKVGTRCGCGGRLGGSRRGAGTRTVGDPARRPMRGLSSPIVRHHAITWALKTSELRHTDGLRARSADWRGFKIGEHPASSRAYGRSQRKHKRQKHNTRRSRQESGASSGLWFGSAAGGTGSCPTRHHHPHPRAGITPPTPQRRPLDAHNPQQPGLPQSQPPPPPAAALTFPKTAATPTAAARQPRLARARACAGTEPGAA